MYSRILFAIDDDEALPAAVPVVAAYARRWAAAVRVVHVHEYQPEACNGADRRLVKSVTDRLAEEGIPVEGEVRLLARQERVGRVIARAAIEARADLVVVGSHGRSDLTALVLGSVSNDVAAGLDVPVLVLRSAPVTAAQPRTILVAVDGSAGSEQAVVEAAEIASAFGAEVVVLHAQLVMTTQGGAIVEPDEDVRAAVGGAATALAARGVRASAATPTARSAAAAVVEAAEQVGADLVVLGSRRPSGLGGLLLGSVAHEVVHRLRCPVLLARRGAVGERVA
ncbi:MAG TPA: universal stress protein [Candidatus Dormibacteraeota bacterium]|nr:universal stress protein [Candidatus Dormibacteraeota bacterium]